MRLLGPSSFLKNAGQGKEKLITKALQSISRGESVPPREEAWRGSVLRDPPVAALTGAMAVQALAIP